MRDFDRITIDLFKSVVTTQTEFSLNGIKNGVLVPKGDKEIVEYAVKHYGIDGGLFNATFHKDWGKVATAPIEQLFFEQILHYMTTYGTNFESSYVYIPAEELDVPELDVDKVTLTVIKPITMDELREKVTTLVSGIALSESTVQDILTIWEEVGLSVDVVKNRELLIAICDKFGVVPSNADMFLRYVLYLATGSTLKIKSYDFLKILKKSLKVDNERRRKVYEAFEYYVNTNGYIPLAKIYNRNKEFFICLKSNHPQQYDGYRWYRKELEVGDYSIANHINKISKLAKRLPQTHFSKGVLDSITDTTEFFADDELIAALDKVTIFKEIAFVNLLNYRLDNSENILYTIRNGKQYVKKNKSFSFADCQILDHRRAVIKEHIKSRVGKNFEGKFFYIPQNFVLGLPTSEKQFVEHIPVGTYIEYNRNDNSNILMGVAWETECDIDAKLANKYGMIGWDGAYRDSNAKVYFSGDMTHLDSNGQASEFHLINGEYAGRYSINLYSNHSEDKMIPYKFIIAKSTRKNLQYTKTTMAVDPNDVIAVLNKEISEKQCAQYIADVEITNDNVRLIFNSEAGENVITSRYNEYDDAKRIERAKKANTQWTLNDFIRDMGGFVSNTTTHPTLDMSNGELVEESIDIDLSFEALSKETILELLK